MDNKTVMAEVLKKEAQSLLDLVDYLDTESIEKMVRIFDSLKNTGGNLLFCGVGKSGYIGQKLASTFCSLGLSSYFLHPVDALHGDLGAITDFDAIIFISKSGTTEEILKLIPFLKIPDASKIGLLGSMNSPIAEKCSVVFNCSVTQEACVNNQAPTNSSTAALALGDALAVLYESITGLSKTDFAQNHPGGILGKSLRLQVKDLMIPKEESPVIAEDGNLKDIVLVMTKFPVGLCSVITDGELKGVVVEGDIRRTLASGNEGLDTPVSKIMTKTPITISPTDLAYQALKTMESRPSPIYVLAVVEGNKFLGTIRMHDLLKAGFSSGS